MDNVSIFLAFFAGLLSFLSPCVLPLVPAYITYLTGITVEDIKLEENRVTVLKKSLGFVLGFSIIFILMGISATSIGNFFLKHNNLFRKLGGILIIIFGIHTTGILKIKFLYYEKRTSIFKFNDNISSVLMGMAFAAGWTPCIGPILASILIYAGNASTLSKGIVLLIAYSFGLAVPFIVTALLIKSFTSYFAKISKYFRIISIVSGIILITMGLMIFTNKFTILSNF